MCELFGLSSNRPIQPGELLCSFGARGGGAADNADGWGLAILEGEGFHIVRQAQAAVDSVRYRALCAGTRSTLILGHVRKANPPTARVIANTHPFRRFCCGLEWVFAHNGIITNASELGRQDATRPCVPMGNTDSELAFCALLDRLAMVFSAHRPREGPGWHQVLAQAAGIFASHGRFNFLMSDGVHLIAYGHDQLHSLADVRADIGAGVVVVATEPLTDHPGWSAFAPGELRIYRAGRQLARFMTQPGHESPVHDRGISGNRPSADITPPTFGVSP